MAKNFIQNGTTIETVVSEDVSSGSPFIIGNVLGVALSDFKANELGVFAVDGVFELPKSGDAIHVGEAVAFDISTLTIVSASSTLSAGDLEHCGVAFSDVDSGDGVVNVKINITGSTITA